MMLLALFSMASCLTTHSFDTNSVMNVDECNSAGAPYVAVTGKIYIVHHSRKHRTGYQHLHGKKRLNGVAVATEEFSNGDRADRDNANLRALKRSSAVISLSIS